MLEQGRDPGNEQNRDKPTNSPMKRAGAESSSRAPIAEEGKAAGGNQFDAPFRSNRIATDGKNILYARAKKHSDEALINLVSNQPREIDSADRAGFPERARIFRERYHLVSVGQTAPNRSRSKTQFRPAERSAFRRANARIARSVKTNGSIEAVTHWFEVSEGEVSDAVEFEMRLAA